MSFLGVLTFDCLISLDLHFQASYFSGSENFCSCTNILIKAIDQFTTRD